MTGKALHPISVLVMLACGGDEVVDPPPPPMEMPSFVERTIEAGFVSARIPPPPPILEIFSIAGGVAAGDVDTDGDVDLFLVSEGSENNFLYLNNGDGTFVEAAEQYGVSVTPVYESGPVFVDFDGDGNLDLIMGGVRAESDWHRYNSVTVFRNTGAQGFVDATAATELALPPEVNTYSISAGDIDGDLDLDLFLSHWRTSIGEDAAGNPVFTHGDRFLWRNDGGVFVDVTTAAGVEGLLYTFTGNFSDVDNDGDQDLLVASDFQNSKVLLNNGGLFSAEPTSVLSDQNGMGSAVGDFDNDGDFDWFVSSIWDPNGVAEGNWEVTGNRLYQNDGDGRFTDVSGPAGTREGYWGWGSCFADFDNDGHLDLFHVNGMQANNSLAFAEFFNDPSRLFMSNGNGSFTERSLEFGLNDTGQGRGVVCFDAERDGDIDIFVANGGGSPSFYVNENLPGLNNYLEVVLHGPPPNTQGIGARIVVTTATLGNQIREIRAGSNYVSQDPAEAHFGLGLNQIADVSVRWPDGEMTVLLDVTANQVVVISHPSL